MPLRPHAGGGGNPQPAQLVLVGERVRLRLVHVLHGDQPDAPVRLVHHQQLLDAVPVQQAARLIRADTVGDSDQPLPRHQLVDLLRRVGRETDVAVGDDADQPVAVALHHRDAADPVGVHQRA